MQATYSFLNTNCAIVGPGGSINLGAGSANAKEGIKIEAINPIDSMLIGADGEGMHSLHADKSGKVTVNLLKTSPVNQKLSLMYAFQTSSAANHGRNTITLANSVTQDVITCQGVAFEKAPELTYAEEGGINTWTFNAVKIDRSLGAAT